MNNDKIAREARIEYWNKIVPQKYRYLKPTKEELDRTGATKIEEIIIKKARQDGFQQGKFEGIAEEKKRSIKLVDINKEVEEIKKQARQAGLQQGKLDLQEWCEEWWRKQETSNELWRHSTEENLIRFLDALKKEVKSQNVNV